MLDRLLGVRPAIGTGTTRRVVLAVYGIDAGGRRELLDYARATAESTAAWRLLRTGLVTRGLPAAAFQLCWTHRVRNILDAPPSGGPASAIYRAPTRPAAVVASWRLARAWRGRHPVLVRRLGRDLDELQATTYESDKTPGGTVAVDAGDRRSEERGPSATACSSDACSACSLTRRTGRGTVGSRVEALRADDLAPSA